MPRHQRRSHHARFRRKVSRQEERRQLETAAGLSGEVRISRSDDPEAEVLRRLGMTDGDPARGADR